MTCLGNTLMLMLAGFIYYYFYSMPSFSNSSASSLQNSFKYDVFLSFRGEDTRKNFVDHLYEALKDKGIYTYKDDEKIKKGERISDDLIKAIEDSKFYIIVFSKNYASSSWCLEELVKIMECQKMTGHTAYPVFYDVEPTHVRKQTGAVGKALAKHESWIVRISLFKNKKKAMLKKWKGALKEAADLAGWELKNTLDGHEAKFIKTIVREISLELRSISFGFDEKLVGMETRVKDVVSSLDNCTDDACMIGIKGMGGIGKTTTARAVFDYLSNDDFEAKCFVEDVREVSNGAGLKKLQEQVLSKVLKEDIKLGSVSDGENMMKKRMRGIKVLLVLDDVDEIYQLEALAGGPNWFKPGSIILITTRDEQVLKARGVNLIRDISLLSDKEAISLFSKYAFGRENPLQGYEELSRKAVSYASGLPLTLKVLGSFLCGKDRYEWEDAIERLKKIPFKNTMKTLELSYESLEEYEYKEIFLDIACILKGRMKEDAIKILKSRGFYARIGLKVLEERSLITSKDGKLGMHDQIEEMGKNIVRREHPDEPNKHSRLWIKEEIEDILANDMGTEATTRYLKFTTSRRNLRIVMKGLVKMKNLQYLELAFADYDWLSGLGGYPGIVDNFDQALKDKGIYLYNDYRSIHNGKKIDDVLCNAIEEYPRFYNTTHGESTDIRKQWQKGRPPTWGWDESVEARFQKIFQDIPAVIDFYIDLGADGKLIGFIGFDMKYNRMAQFREEGEEKVLKKLKFLSLERSNLLTFDLGMTPNLETLSLKLSYNLIALCIPVTCQKLKHLEIGDSRLIRTFDLGLTPNLETLTLYGCTKFEELHVSAPCPNLKSLQLRSSRLRSLDLELISNLEYLDLVFSKELVEIKLPVCVKQVMLYGCALLEKLPEDLGRSGCLRYLDITDTSISHLPQSIFRLKGLMIVASPELLQLYDFPSEIITSSWSRSSSAITHRRLMSFKGVFQVLFLVLNVAFHTFV